MLLQSSLPAAYLTALPLGAHLGNGVTGWVVQSPRGPFAQSARELSTRPKSAAESHGKSLELLSASISYPFLVLVSAFISKL